MSAGPVVLAYYYNVATLGTLMPGFLNLSLLLQFATLGTLMPGFLNLSGVPSVSTQLTASTKHASKLNRFGERLVLLRPCAFWV